MYTRALFCHFLQELHYLVHFIFYLCPWIQFCSFLLSYSSLISLLCVPITMNIMLDWHICQSSWWRNDLLPFIPDVISTQTTLFSDFFLVSDVCCFCCYCCYLHCHFPAAASFLHRWPSSTVLCSLCSFSVFAVLNYCVLQFQSLADQFPYCIPTFAL